MLKTTINILGYDMTFTEHTSKSFEDITETIATNAPEELLMKLNKLPKTKFIALMSDILVELTTKLDLDNEISNTDWRKTVQK